MAKNETLAGPMPDEDPAPSKILRDPWIHRGEHMRCFTCMWFTPKQGNVGRCRRRSPTLSGYPAVYANADWCGDHKIDEEVMREMPF